MKDLWNQRFGAAGYFYGTEPNAFLASQAGLLQPGWQVLSVADGEGRNGVWLAEQGLDVLAVDFSEQALEKSRRLAQARGVALRTELADLFDWTWGEDRFDAIVAIFIQFASSEERPVLHSAIRRALKPGGILFMQGYTPRQLEYRTGGPSNPDNLYGAEVSAARFRRHGHRAVARARFRYQRRRRPQRHVRLGGLGGSETLRFDHGAHGGHGERR